MTRLHKRYIPAIAASGILALQILIPPSPSAAAGRNADADRQLRERGWAIDTFQVEGTDKPGVRRVYAEARLQIPAATAWQIVAGEGGSKRWPNIKESVLEWSSGDTTIRRYTLSIPVYRDRRYKLRNIADRDRMIFRFEMIPGYGNVRQIEGSWQISALSDSSSRLVYRLDTDPGVRLVPGFIVSWATQKAIPRTFAHIYDQGSLELSDDLRLGERID